MNTHFPLVHLNVRMPPSVFMGYVPMGARILPSDLVRRGEAVNAGLRHDFLGEWWALQGDINSILDASANRGLKLFYDDAKECLKRGQRELRNDSGPAAARLDFLRSAVLFACAGERGIFLIRALTEAAASYRVAPERPAAAAIIYEHLFRVSRRPNDAASAAASWLDSIRGDPDERTIGFRIGRGRSLAERGSAEVVYEELVNTFASQL